MKIFTFFEQWAKDKRWQPEIKDQNAQSLDVVGVGVNVAWSDSDALHANEFG